MAVVFFVISASICEASMVRLSRFISANTGSQFSHTIDEVVATYENGVVITSPVIPSPLMAICRAEVPLFKKIKWLAPK